QSQAISFAPGKHAYVFLNLFPTKQKSTQNITHFTAVGLVCSINHGVQNRFLAVQIFGLVLSKISNLNIMTRFQNSFIINLTYKDFCQGRFPLSVLSYKSNF